MKLIAKVFRLSAMDLHDVRSPIPSLRDTPSAALQVPGEQVMIPGIQEKPLKLFELAEVSESPTAVRIGYSYEIDGLLCILRPSPGVICVRVGSVQVLIESESEPQITVDEVSDGTELTDARDTVAGSAPSDSSVFSEP